MIVSLLAGVLLDNLIPGTRAERGMTAWDSTRKGGHTDPEFMSVYGLPKWGSFNLAAIFRNCSYLDAVESVTEKPHKLTWPEVPPEGPMSSSGDLCEMCCPFIPAFRPAITKQEA